MLIDEYPSGDVKDKGERKKGEGRERKRREKERKPRLCLVSFELPRRTPRRTKGVLQFFKIIP